MSTRQPATHQYISSHPQSQTAYRHYCPKDVEISSIVFGANCGPAALAASLSRDIADVMRYLPHFEDENKRYTTLTKMKAALVAASIPFEVRKKTYPSRGLALVQWTGPWTEKHFFSKWSLRYTHWIAVDGPMIYDIHCRCWLPIEAWESDVVPTYLKELPQAAGWAIKYGVETGNSSSNWQESFLETLFRRPKRMLSE